jgi:lytic murein transglycosylase
MRGVDHPSVGRKPDSRFYTVQMNPARQLRLVRRVPVARAAVLAVRVVLALLSALASTTSLAKAAPERHGADCITRLRADLPQFRQVQATTFDQHTRLAEDVRPAIQSASRSQPEFQTPIWDYLARLVDQRRINDGMAVIAQEAAHLQRIGLRHGVDPATVVAIFGIESDFGRHKGKFKVIDATLARACLDLSSKEKKAHFFAALWLVQQALVEAENFRGSWAGAFGMTQFMPGTYLRHMTDGDGDGRIDTVSNRADALATTASYLQSLGWTPGLPWGIEVRAPEDLARQASSKQREHACLATGEVGVHCRRLDQWASLGLRLADGRALLNQPTDPDPDWPALGPSSVLALLTPAGAQGPAWLVSRNFQALWHYNRADAYALAVGQLSSALRGDPPQSGVWPDAEATLALSRKDTAELQTWLLAQGHCALVADGYDGPVTREAIRVEERRRGLPESGRPTLTWLSLARASGSPEVSACGAPEAPAPPSPVLTGPS